ncbi:hypothetical protein EMCG_06840 [[Emmonsia] crescens]|uniref:Uncharacterized protein n=1 Tax=[Emmonsia] crescens TaxID=73230 RepID=A0A0G2J6B1_9EURO|nr:hypothetical protein EMCG_06840 [Emmonsia crescens UAMH 3008]
MEVDDVFQQWTWRQQFDMIHMRHLFEVFSAKQNFKQVEPDLGFRPRKGRFHKRTEKSLQVSLRQLGDGDDDDNGGGGRPADEDSRAD